MALDETVAPGDPDLVEFELTADALAEGGVTAPSVFVNPEDTVELQIEEGLSTDFTVERVAEQTPEATDAVQNFYVVRFEVETNGVEIVIRLFGDAPIGDLDISAVTIPAPETLLSPAA